jgi:Tfp pilus assembly protein PilF
MLPDIIEKMIADGRDSYEARLAAGQARLGRGELELAIGHLDKATEFKPGQSVAWQALGQAWQQSGDAGRARSAWERGLAAARANGDVQAEKVMTVWLKRLERAG